MGGSEQCPELTERFTIAVRFAWEKHDGQFRKGTTIPYLSHLLAVASLAIEDAASDPLLADRLDDIAIAAVLHDVVEDTLEDSEPVTAKDVGERFGHVVAMIVAGCTDAETLPKPPWRDRKEAYIEHLEVADQAVLCVALADKRHNARCIVNDAQAAKSTGNEGFWDRFNAGPTDQSWYYTALAEVLCKRRPGAAAKELESTVRLLELLAGP